MGNKKNEIDQPKHRVKRNKQATAYYLLRGPHTWELEGDLRTLRSTVVDNYLYWEYKTRKRNEKFEENRCKGLVGEKLPDIDVEPNLRSTDITSDRVSIGETTTYRRTYSDPSYENGSRVDTMRISTSSGWKTNLLEDERFSCDIPSNPNFQQHTSSYINDIFSSGKLPKSSFIEMQQIRAMTSNDTVRTNNLNNDLHKPFTCDACGKRFSQRSSLNTHKLSHSSKKPFACDLCEKTFTVKGNLKIHQLIHKGIKPYACDICDKRFTQSCNLNTHKITHSGNKPFSCNICQKNFTVKGSLKIHQLTHSGERHYTCDICEKTFTQNSSLTTHKLIHTGTKPFKCEICHKSFGLKGNLKTHMLVHSGSKPFPCEICGKSFGTRHNLKTHQLTHTGEKPFSCDICYKRFTHRISLKSHVLMHSDNGS